MQTPLKIKMKLKSNLILLSVLCIIVGLVSTGFTYVQSSIKERYEQIRTQPISGTVGEKLLTIAQHFKGVPYVAHTLESETGEQLVCRFDAFDCTTLVENLVALTRSKQQNATFEAFQEELTRVRYRNGQINHYGSRLHYFVDWAHENEQRGIVKNISQQLGGVLHAKPIHFMSTKKELYKGISSESILDEIKQAETNINSRERYYIPVQKIASIEHLLQDGDIVGITSTIDGLDCNHQGVIKKIGKKAHLYHASSKEMKVVLSSNTIAEYVASSKKNDGIIVMRMVEPN